MLHIKALEVKYDQLTALKSIDLQVAQGEIVSLIGSNGAGKTTLLKSIAGLLPVSKGSIHFKDQSLDKMPPQDRVAMGISLCPEGRQVFPKMTVRENLEMGAYLLKDRKRAAENEAMVYDLFPRLFERRRQTALTLSGGEQQMLAMGRALMNNPTLLLLDEPSLGLAPLLVDSIFQLIEKINLQGTTVLLVEQNAHMALNISHRGYVMENGDIRMEGKADDLLKDQRVKQIYLGEL